MNLSKQLIEKSRKKRTPFLLTDLSAISNNYTRLKNALNKTSIYYAIKSNADPIIISHLWSLGSNFDVASWNEIDLAIHQGVSPNHLLFSAPVKKVLDIKKANRIGVNQYTFDSIEELEKLHVYAPGSKLILRIFVDSEGSHCPMFTRFGVYLDQAINLLRKSMNLGMIPLGLTFHVGSQCTNPESWEKALIRINKIWLNSISEGMNLRVINLGGGFPVPYSESVPSIEVILHKVNDYLQKSFPNLEEIYIEPGRYMTDQASVMVSSVIGKATRGKTEWLHLDVGGFNGLFEIFENFEYEIQTAHPERIPHEYAVCGPTCDGMDIIRKSIILPEVRLGERVYIMNSGAYSLSINKYNGFDWARSYHL